MKTLPEEAGQTTRRAWPLTVYGFVTAVTQLGVVDQRCRAWPLTVYGFVTTSVQLPSLCQMRLGRAWPLTVYGFVTPRRAGTATHYRRSCRAWPLTVYGFVTSPSADSINPHDETAGRAWPLTVYGFVTFKIFSITSFRSRSSCMTSYRLRFCNNLRSNMLNANTCRAWPLTVYGFVTSCLQQTALGMNVVVHDLLPFTVL